MNKSEAREANTCHAIWDIIVMKHSVESVLDTYEITVSDIENVYYRLKEKCDEYWLGRIGRKRT